MICVVWILQLCLLSGPVMKEQAFVSAQNNTAPNDSVSNWTEGREQQAEAVNLTWFVKLQPTGLTNPSPPPITFHPTPPRPPPLPKPCNDTVMKKEKKPFLPVFRFAADFMFCLWACLISMLWGLNSRFGNVLLHSATAAQFGGSGGASLDVAVVICAVRLWHIHLSHGVTHVVHPVLAGWHALVDAVQALSLLKAGDLVLRGEPADGWEETTHTQRSDFVMAQSHYIPVISYFWGIVWNKYTSF